MNTIVYLGLGSNLGDRLALLRYARQDLEKLVLNDLKASPIYESAPYLGAQQPVYYNQVVKGHTTMSPVELLDACHTIEYRLGRVRNKRWESRLIDIDILFYGDLIMESGKLCIPHPEFQNRGPVLIPLYDLSPDWTDPKTNKPIQELLELWKQRTSEPYPIAIPH